MSTGPLMTDDVIVIPIPTEFAAEFLQEIDKLPRDRSVHLIRIGTAPAGTWRVEGVSSDSSLGFLRMVATLRRVLA